MSAAATTVPIAKAQIEINIPFRAQLKFPNGLPLPAANSQFPEAGDRVMYTLVDGRKLYLPAPVSETMGKLGGQDFYITKKQALAGRKITWTVNRADKFGPDVARAVQPPAAARVEPAYDDGDDPRSWGDPPPLDHEEPAPTPAAAPPIAPAVANASESPQKSPSRMTAALIAAIDATAEATAYARTVGITLKFAEEDIRAVAATIYIQNARSSQ